MQRIVLEVKSCAKRWRKRLPTAWSKRGELSNADELHFVMFDRSNWSKKIFQRTRKLCSTTIKAWGM